MVVFSKLYIFDNCIISCNPLVINDACALSPKLRPLHIPEAIAITFLTAPPT